MAAITPTTATGSRRGRQDDTSDDEDISDFFRSLAGIHTSQRKAAVRRCGRQLVLTVGDLRRVASQEGGLRELFPQLGVRARVQSWYRQDCQHDRTSAGLSEPAVRPAATLQAQPANAVNGNLTGTARASSTEAGQSATLQAQTTNAVNENRAATTRASIQAGRSEPATTENEDGTSEIACILMSLSRGEPEVSLSNPPSTPSPTCVKTSAKGLLSRPPLTRGPSKEIVFEKYRSHNMYLLRQMMICLMSTYGPEEGEYDIRPYLLHISIEVLLKMFNEWFPNFDDHFYFCKKTKFFLPYTSVKVEKERRRKLRMSWQEREKKIKPPCQRP